MDGSGNYHSVHQKTSRVYPRGINRHPTCRILAAALDIAYALYNSTVLLHIGHNI